MSSPVRIARKPLPADLKKELVLEAVQSNDSDIVEQPLATHSKSLRIFGWEFSAYRLPSTPHKPGYGQGVFASFSEKFNRVVPPNRKYLGRSRKTLLIVLVAIFLVLIGLIVGLAVGLTIGRKGYGTKTRIIVW
jgi:hypothetical protein